MKAKPQLKAEAVRLRVEERMSLREIHNTTGASKGSLSVWLKPYPLIQSEKIKRTKHPFTRPRKSRGEQSKFHSMIAPETLTKLQKAKIAESAVLFRLVLLGFIPFGSVFDGDKVDWMVEVPETGRIVKLQVRWLREAKHGLPPLGLRCTEGHNTSRRFKRTDFDFIVGYDLFTDVAYVFAEKEVSQRKACVTITPSAAEAWDKLRQA